MYCLFLSQSWEDSMSNGCSFFPKYALWLFLKSILMYHLWAFILKEI